MMAAKYQKMLDIKRTQLELVRDRGYDITRESNLLTGTLEQFYKYYSQKAREEK